MAIIGVRSDLIVGYTTGLKTGLIWTVDSGAGTVESNQQVLAANLSTQLLGRALNAAGVRTTIRQIPQAVNLREDNSGI